MIQCRDIAEEASNYLDGDLPMGKRVGMFLHLVICSYCRRYIKQIRQTIMTVGSLRPQEDHSTDTRALAEKLRALSKSES